MGFPSQNTGVGCHFLFQGIFLTQGSIWVGMRILYHWATKEAPEWTKTMLVFCVCQFLRISTYKFMLSEDRKSFTAAAAKSLQSCPTLWDPRDGSPPGSPVPGILQARTVEWVAISFSHAWKWKVKVKSLSRVRLLATPWTAAYQAPPSMGFARQEYWSGLPLPSPKFTSKFQKQVVWRNIVPLFKNCLVYSRLFLT